MSGKGDKVAKAAGAATAAKPHALRSVHLPAVHLILSHATCQPLIADYANGNIYELDPDGVTDNGMAIAREITGRHFFIENDRVTVDELYIDMAVGVGTTTGQGVNPQAMLQVSKDNGETFGSEQWKPLGKIGKYLTRAVWRRLGLGRDWTFKIRVTDPIKFAVSFGAMKVRK